MKYVITALIPLVLLTGCTKGLSSAKPDLITYSKEVQKQAAEEIPACPVLSEFMKDYLTMRDQVRTMK